VRYLRLKASSVGFSLTHRICDTKALVFPLG
jgi:hypothetical protein